MGKRQLLRGLSIIGFASVLLVSYQNCSQTHFSVEQAQNFSRVQVEDLRASDLLFEKSNQVQVSQSFHQEQFMSDKNTLVLTGVGVVQGIYAATHNGDPEHEGFLVQGDRRGYLEVRLYESQANQLVFRQKLLPEWDQRWVLAIVYEKTLEQSKVFLNGFPLPLIETRGISEVSIPFVSRIFAAELSLVKSLFLFSRALTTEELNLIHRYLSREENIPVTLSYLGGSRGDRPPPMFNDDMREIFTASNCTTCHSSTGPNRMENILAQGGPRIFLDSFSADGQYIGTKSAMANVRISPEQRRKIQLWVESLTKSHP